MYRALTLLVALALPAFAATGNARAAAPPLDPAAQASEQDAWAGQAATASADAEEPQPTNVFVSVRVDSPGDTGPVTQESTVAVAGAAENTASTTQTASQDWAPAATPLVGQVQPLGHGQTSEQDAASAQTSAATASAARPQPVNVVVSVRVNSPGDDGPVTQRSGVVVGAASTNAASTTQTAAQTGSGAGGAAPLVGTKEAAKPAASPAPAPASAEPAAAPGAVTRARCVRIDRVRETGLRVVIGIGASCEAPRERPAAFRAPRPARAEPAPPAPTPIAHAVAPAPQPVSHAQHSAARPRRAPASRGLTVPARPAPRELPRASIAPRQALGLPSVDAVRALSSSAGRERWSVLLALALVLGALGAATVGSSASFLLRGRRRT